MKNPLLLAALALTLASPAVADEFSVPVTEFVEPTTQYDAGASDFTADAEDFGTPDELAGLERVESRLPRVEDPLFDRNPSNTLVRDVTIPKLYGPVDQPSATADQSTQHDGRVSVRVDVKENSNETPSRPTKVVK